MAVWGKDAAAGDITTAIMCAKRGKLVCQCMTHNVWQMLPQQRSSVLALQGPQLQCT
jgi:hypothetical protein